MDNYKQKPIYAQKDRFSLSFSTYIYIYIYIRTYTAREGRSNKDE